MRFSRRGSGMVLAAGLCCSCSSPSSRASDASAPDVVLADASTTADLTLEVAPADASAGDASSLPTGTALVYVTKNGTSEILSLSLDLATGTATSPTSSATTPVGRTVLNWARGGRFLHALTTELTSFGVDGATGELHLLGSSPVGKGAPQGLALAPDETWLVTTDYLQGATWFKLAADGHPLAPGGPLSSGPAPGVPAIDGPNAFVPACEDDTITTYAWNDGQPKATSTVTLPTGGGPREIVFHPSHAWAYVLEVKSDAVTVLDHANGVLDNPRSVSTKPANGSLGSSSCGLTGHLALHPTGRFAYVTRDAGNSVGILAIDAAGTPSFVGISDHYLFRGADALAVDPTGHFLLVANTSGPLQSFAIDQGSGKLTFVDNAPALSGVTSLAFAPR